MMMTDEVRNSYWYIEVDTFRASTELMERLRALAKSGLWRKVEDVPSNEIPLLRAVFWPLRPEDV